MAAAKEATQKIPADADITDKSNELNVAALTLHHSQPPSANKDLPAPLKSTVHCSSANDTSRGGHQHHTLTQFWLDHAKEVEERNTRAERLKLKKMSTKGKGVQNKPVGMVKASGKGNKKLK